MAFSSSLLDRFAHWCMYIVILIILGALLPLVIKQEAPEMWGFAEGIVGFDMTGFAFTPIGGSGNCRVENTRAAFRSGGSKIVFGVISEPSGHHYLHLWTETAKGGIIDSSCPVVFDRCKERRSFALLDSSTFMVLSQSPLDKEESETIIWGRKYLGGFKRAWKFNGD